jgi:ATP-dependent DNA helicase PIF1
MRQGLCNGTRLQIIDTMKNVLHCVILNGDQKGETAFIPRISLIEDKKFFFKLKRHQFPVKLAFCFSINKSQSQTFTKIGIDLQNEVFAHGQCYVAFSRAKSWNGIKVKLDPENKEKKIRNVVWEEAL